MNERICEGTFTVKMNEGGNAIWSNLFVNCIIHTYVYPTTNFASSY